MRMEHTRPVPTDLALTLFTIEYYIYGTIARRYIKAHSLTVVKRVF